MKISAVCLYADSHLYINLSHVNLLFNNLLKIANEFLKKARPLPKSLDNSP